MQFWIMPGPVPASFVGNLRFCDMNLWFVDILTKYFVTNTSLYASKLSHKTITQNFIARLKMKRVDKYLSLF